MNSKTKKDHLSLFSPSGGGRISEIHISNVLANRRLRLNWIVEEDESRAKQIEELLCLQDIPFYKAEELTRLLDDER